MRRKKGSTGSYPSAVPLVVLAFLAGSLLVPSAAASGYPFGSFVSKADFEYTPTAEAVTSVQLCFIDTDGSSAYEPSEPLILHFEDNCDRVAYEDRCLICLDDHAPGHEIEIQDRAYDRDLRTPADHAIRFTDRGGEGEVSDETPVYVDLFHVDQEKVHVGDVRLTGFGNHSPVSIVQPGDGDLAWPLSEIAGDETKFEQDDVVYEAGEGIYVNTDEEAIPDTDSFVEETDVRLNAGVPEPWASSNPAAEPANVTVTSLDAPAEVTAGSPLRISIGVANTGSGSGSHLVETRIDGTVVDARGTPVLASGEATRLVATLVAPEEPEQITLRAGGASASLNVTPPSTSAVDVEEDVARLQERVVQLEERLQTGSPDGANLSSNAAGSAEEDVDDTDVDEATVPGASAALVSVALLGVALVRRGGRGGDA